MEDRLKTECSLGLEEDGINFENNDLDSDETDLGSVGTDDDLCRLRDPEDLEALDSSLDSDFKDIEIEELTDEKLSKLLLFLRGE